MHQETISNISRLATTLDSLHKGYAIRRFLVILTVALAADLSLDIIALLTTWFLDWSFHIPFFFETILIVLLIKESLALRREAFVLFLDRSFGLKDRLYSFHSFARPRAQIPLEVRESQASECLDGIEFDALREKLKPRVPPFLLILAPIFLWIVYSSLNTDYIPPGTVSRTAIKLISPETLKEYERTARQTASREDREAAALTSSGDGQKEGNKTEEPHKQGAAEGEHKNDEPAPPIDEGGDAENNDAGPDSLQKKRGSESDQRASEENSDSPIESQLVTEGITEPGPEMFRDGVDTEPGELKDPSHLLNLLPLTETDTEEDIEALILKMAGQQLEDYPVRYRNHINRYFEELTLWQKDETHNSTRN